MMSAPIRGPLAVFADDGEGDPYSGNNEGTS